jgi:hypothetical protein
VHERILRERGEKAVRELFAARRLQTFIRLEVEGKKRGREQQVGSLTCQSVFLHRHIELVECLHEDLSLLIVQPEHQVVGLILCETSECLAVSAFCLIHLAYQVPVEELRPNLILRKTAQHLTIINFVNHLERQILLLDGVLNRICEKLPENQRRFDALRTQFLETHGEERGTENTEQQLTQGTHKRNCGKLEKRRKIHTLNFST